MRVSLRKSFWLSSKNDPLIVSLNKSSFARTSLATIGIPIAEMRRLRPASSPVYWSNRFCAVARSRTAWSKAAPISWGVNSSPIGKSPELLMRCIMSATTLSRVVPFALNIAVFCSRLSEENKPTRASPKELTTLAAPSMKPSSSSPPRSSACAWRRVLISPSPLINSDTIAEAWR